MNGQYDHEGGLEDPRSLQIQMLEDCQHRKSKLSEKELLFVNNCLDNLEYYDTLTTKQIKWLNAIWDRVTGE